MAVAPLFAADVSTVKSELRLSGLKSGSDGEQIFTRALSSARVGLYMRLGTSVIAEMVAQADTDNPTSLTGLRRKACTLAEVEWIRMELLKTMPIRVADASGDEQDVYGDEGVWRDISPDELEEALKRILEGIEELMELVLTEDELGDDASIRVFDGSRDSEDNDDIRYPGGTLWGTIGKFVGNFEPDYIYSNGDIAARFVLETD
jgi:hypothetical protein